MRIRSRALIVAAFVSACLLSPPGLADEDVRVAVIVHPTRAGRLSRAEVRAIYLKQKRFWDDGQAIVPINQEAGSPVRELFSETVLGQGSRRLAGYWNQRYFEVGEFPPATLASEQAVVRFVAGNRNAIGYVTMEHVSDSVAVVLVLR